MRQFLLSLAGRGRRWTLTLGRLADERVLDVTSTVAQYLVQRGSCFRREMNAMISTQRWRRRKLDGSSHDALVIYQDY